MVTKQALRDLVRRRLEDTSPAAPLWDDTDLDDALSDALARYDALAPLESRTEVAVTDGDTHFSVSGLERSTAIARVLDPAGDVLPLALAEVTERQGWRWWAGEIWLSKPATAGTWTVEWRQVRLLTAGETDPVPVRPGDEGAVSLLAAASALRRRAVEEAKRGGRGTRELLLLASSWEQRAERGLLARNRRVRAFTAGRS